MTDDEIITVVSAHKEGKKIQFSTNGVDWYPCGSPCWNFQTYDYRVAPEPPKFLKGYCFAKDIHDTPLMGMIKVEQVALAFGENPLGATSVKQDFDWSTVKASTQETFRTPREWRMALYPDGIIGNPPHSKYVQDYEIITVREVLE